MSKRAIAVIVALSVLLAGCGRPMVIDGTRYDTCGVLTMNECDEDIQYKVIIGNVIWAVLLIETVIAPVYFFGFSIWEPVGKKKPKKAELPKP